MNSRRLAKPAAKATSVIGRAGGLDEQPRGLGSLGPGEGERPGAELGVQLALDLARAVAEPRGQAGDTLSVDHAVGDEAHGPRDQVGPRVPLRGAGGGIRPAALAGPEARELGGGGARVEAHVLRLGRHDGTARPAVDAVVTTR